MDSEFSFADIVLINLYICFLISTSTYADVGTGQIE